MNVNERNGRKPSSVTWAAAFTVVAVLAAGVFVWAAGGRGWQAVPLVAALVVATALVKGRFFRARAARRRSAILDAYADREIARTRRRQSLPRIRTLSVPGTVQPSSRAS
jgi:hypothetical protein